MPDDLVEQIDEELQTDIQQNKDSNSKPCRASPGRPLVADPPPTEQGFLYPYLYDGG